MTEMENNDNKITTVQENTDTDNSFLGRLRRVKPTRWVRFGLVTAVFIFWVVLMGNPWLLFLWLLIADIYITNYVPWGWWKKKKGLTRSLMAWVDAIVYALVLIYFVFAFVGQQYEIPSSSLEKSLLIGDRLWVDKTVYGARVPQTPIHFPLAQHTLPLLNCKSYIDNPQLDYHRLPGVREIERGDIVVFNYPQGDTVTLKVQNPDYYMIIDQLVREGVRNPRAYIAQHPEVFGEVVVRPVDRRENYVKRAIGLPGERIRIKSDTIYINGKAIAEPENVQYNYIIPVTGAIEPERWQELGVNADDHGGTPMRNEFTGELFYDVPLTYAAKKTVEVWPEVKGKLVRESESGYYDLSGMFPTSASAEYGWTRPNMGEFWIPKRGSTLHITPQNYAIYERAIRTYEGNKVERRGDTILINGKPTEYYTFKMDYYWMMGDNRDRSADSRYWGFVPEDHIVGSPVFIIVSLDKERGLTDGKIRWNRILKNPNPDRSSGKWKE